MKKYKFMCEKLNISYKRNIFFLTLLMVALISLAVLSALQDSLAMMILLLICGILIVLNHFSSIKANFKQLTNAKEIAFNGFYRYVITLLKNNHVLYGALQASLEYVDEVLQQDVNELIIEIENDVSIDPFFKFMENFDDDTIKQMILLLYKTQEVGVADEVIDSINECMVNLQDTSLVNFVNKEENKVQKYYIFPIVLSAAVMIIITLYIFTMLSEGIYV